MPAWRTDSRSTSTDVSRRFKNLILSNKNVTSVQTTITPRSPTAWRWPTVALLLPLCLLAGCATTPPSSPENLCQIFREKPGWHKQALKVQKKWNVPPQVAMAMMYQESSFRHDAQPPRRYLLGFIPWGRVSTAYGYAQAKDETWADYKREAGGMFASRDNFGDALDFMGWYMDKTQRVNGTSKWDAYAQYLNYHEGWGGYRNGSHKSKAWLLRTATTVQSRAERFGAQYRSCEKSL
ncbi:transglycosylase SLT domain-containing protein [Alcaligenaceae bacterium]|nr:transglycosylase SLT domain-containing protein [Alcaligenaceae bacterium]